MYTSTVSFPTTLYADIHFISLHSAFERALERHATHLTLEPTYNPALLARAPALSADIAHLLDVTEAAWKTHPIHEELVASPPAALKAYVSRIEFVAASTDPSALLAHSYVRYMGDLSGGQTIRHTLAKAYGLDEAAGEGVSFYAFKELRSAKAANQGEMKRIKEWFREGMNKAGEQGSVIKGEQNIRPVALFCFFLRILSPFSGLCAHERGIIGSADTDWRAMTECGRLWPYEL